MRDYTTRKDRVENKIEFRNSDKRQTILQHNHRNLLGL